MTLTLPAVPPATMHTIEDFRRRQIEILRSACRIPVMYEWCGQCAESFFLRLLSDLTWIDEREADWDAATRRFLWGSRRVMGQFVDQGLRIPDYINEITSTYAQVAHVLGYFLPNRVLSDKELCGLKDSLSADFFSRNWTKSQLYEQFGAPCHEIVGGDTTVACYAADNDTEPWVFFDFSRNYPGNDTYFEDPILRDMRIEQNRFQLLPFADWCKRETA